MEKSLSKLLDKVYKTKPGIVKKTDEVNKDKTILLSSPSLNYIFGGAFPIGKIISIFGPFSGGKSTLTNYICGQLQQKMPEGHQTIIYGDFERSFNKDFATENGLDCLDVSEGGKLLYLQPDSMEDFFDVICELIPTGTIAGIIMDSESAAPTKVAFTNETGKATFGRGAAILTDGLKKTNILCANYNTSMVLISQERAQMNTMSHAIATTGGNFLPYICSWRGRVTKIETIESAGETIGQHIKIRNYKSKVGVPFRTAEMNLYYKGGFDTDSEYLDFMINLGLIHQAGAWFTNDKYQIKLNGKAKVAEWLKSHPEEYKELIVETNELIMKQNQLDIANIDPDTDGKIQPIEEEIPDDILENTDDN